MSELPSLYKYRNINSEKDFERLEEIIIGNEIYFPSPSLFNDPFDCHPAFDFSGTKSSIRSDFSMLQKKYGPTVGRNIRRQEVRTIFRDPGRDPRRLEVQNAMLNDYEQSINSVGILCVTERNNDILMWSHYADSHKGICLQFN